MATQTVDLGHTFAETATYGWPRNCEVCGITVFGPGSTHCPERARRIIAAADVLAEQIYRYAAGNGAGGEVIGALHAYNEAKS